MGHLPHNPLLAPNHPHYKLILIVCLFCDPTVHFFNESCPVAQENKTPLNYIKSCKNGVNSLILSFTFNWAFMELFKTVRKGNFKFQ